MREGTQNGLIVAGVVTSILALGLGLPLYCGWHFATFGDADEVRRVRFLRDGGDVRLLSVECLTGDNSACRITLLDARSGQRLARLVRDDQTPACQPAVPGRLWCRDDALGIYLLDSRRLEIAADQARLLGQSPLLASGLSSFEPLLELAGRGLVVGTNAGLKVRLDPTTLEASQVAEPTREESLELDADDTAEEYSLETGGFRYSFEGSASTDRLRLKRHDLTTHQDAPLPVGAESARGEAAGADTFLKGSFVKLLEGPGRAPATLLGPGGFLVVHASSLDEEQARRLLSRVDERGRCVWTTEIPRGRVLAAERLAVGVGEERVVLVLGAEANTALSLGLQDGALRWQARL